MSGLPGTATNGGSGGDFYWVFKQLRGYDISKITKQPEWDFYAI